MIINIGSINIDHVYRVAQMPSPGETLAVASYEKFLGGKGANQSISIVKSGGTVRHVGAVGPDGEWVLEQLSVAGLDLQNIANVDAPTGHAVIAVDDAGENQILICSGANLALSLQTIANELDRQGGAGHWVLLQNETNLTAEIVREAKARGYNVAYSAAPFVAEQTIPLLAGTDLLVVNELEAAALATALGVALEAIPVPLLLVTRGSAGAALHACGNVIEQPAFAVDPADTTGAGDTFLGAFLAQYAEGVAAEDALRFAAAASALQITRPGAATAIPERAEVERFLDEVGR